MWAKARCSSAIGAISNSGPVCLRSSLASGTDLWHAGGGVYQPWTFGYQGRAGNGATSLANLYDVDVDVTLNKYLSVTPYLGSAHGKSVIQYIYPKGKDGHLAFLETTIRF